MRWDGQRLDGPDGDADPDAVGPSPSPPRGRGRGFDDVVLPGLERQGLIRTVTTPEFEGVRFHEVLARSALNQVPEASGVPFRWTVNPYRGCTHACVYCFARGTHAWLELDTGTGFDSDIVVKTNLVPVLRAELRRRSWKREHVALGTNTDPYQRAEGRYRLMPGVIRELAASGTPFSVLTKGTLLRRDLPLLRSASRSVPVGLAVSLALWDEPLHHSLEPGTPSPRARLDLIRAIREAGFDCGVLLAPVLPGLSDSREHLTTAVERIAEAGATSLTVIPLHLRPGAREWFWQWLSTHHPALLRYYRRLYGRGAYVGAQYRDWLAERVAPLLAEHGLDRSPFRTGEDHGHPDDARPTTGPTVEQPALL